MENKIFIKNIKYLREYLNLTQKEFGEKLGKRYNTIQNWERGRSIPDNTTKEHIKNTLNVNLDWLFNDKGEMFNSIQNTSYKWELLELIIETVEELFIIKKLYLIPSKKARLIRMLYEYLDKQIIEDNNNGKIIKLQDYFDTKYKNNIINMVSSL